MLPISDEIHEYLLLAGGPSLVQGVEAGKETVVTKWLPSGLLHVSTDDIRPGKTLRIPPLVELEATAKKEKVIFDKLYADLERARNEAEKRDKIPVGPDTKVPWWAK